MYSNWTYKKDKESEEYTVQCFGLPGVHFFYYYFFFDLSSARNMVRVIEGKII